MDDIARLPDSDRADVFTSVGTARGLSSEMMEKDFWVCWTLRRIFALSDLPAGLLFKGGTSLSKVFGIIERFSEDVDLSLNRADIGFGGPDDPAASRSRKQRDKQLAALSEERRRMVHERLLPRLTESFLAALGDAHAGRWQLTTDDLDRDSQTIVFQYPAATRSRQSGEPAYIAPAVRLEFGARSDHWPAVRGVVTPYAAEDHPELFKAPLTQVLALAPQRTFWEKATELHRWSHAAPDKPLPARQSRHYYDVVMLRQQPCGEAAVKDMELLRNVVEHKRTFFAAAWARYEEAKPGSLRLVPPDFRIAELDRDYQKMAEMIFGEIPPFDEILNSLSHIEKEFNATN